MLVEVRCSKAEKGHTFPSSGGFGSVGVPDLVWLMAAPSTVPTPPQEQSKVHTPRPTLGIPRPEGKPGNLHFLQIPQRSCHLLRWGHLASGQACRRPDPGLGVGGGKLGWKGEAILLGGASMDEGWRAGWQNSPGAKDPPRICLQESGKGLLGPRITWLITRALEGGGTVFGREGFLRRWH